ncbi:hypothetical protein EXN66_Car000948 [Channa argus]|uniref:Uncharacterized protein n=1 Tax=Channa argus TaxID=215402 RepID=A0A6G1QZ29_CHAAH|nr:hypothetical protein EXN66_Car000948 [Channa argus]
MAQTGHLKKTFVGPPLTRRAEPSPDLHWRGSFQVKPWRCPVQFSRRRSTLDPVEEECTGTGTPTNIWIRASSCICDVVVNTVNCNKKREQIKSIDIRLGVLSVQGNSAYPG